MNKGMLLAISAYFLWGLSPLYWKLHQTVPVDQVLAHRCIWTFVFMLIIMAFRGDWGWIQKLLRRPKTIVFPTLAAVLLSANWYTYTWAITNNQVVEASLGYFINPLISLLLGVLFLKERLRRLQVISFVFAFIGVSVFTWSVGALPLVSLTLALSFGFYGLMKKKVEFQPAQGMSIETGLFLLPAILFLLTRETSSITIYPILFSDFDLINITTGIATGLPLVLFAAAAKNLKLISIGIFQYIAPSLQFSLGVFLFNEHFSQEKLIGFIFIWLGLCIFTLESLYQNRKKTSL